MVTCTVIMHAGIWKLDHASDNARWKTMVTTNLGSKGLTTEEWEIIQPPGGVEIGKKLSQYW